MQGLPVYNEGAECVFAKLQQPPLNLSDNAIRKLTGNGIHAATLGAVILMALCFTEVLS